MTLGAVTLGAMTLGAVAPTFRTVARMAAHNTRCDTLFEFFQLKVQVFHLVSPPFWLSDVKPCDWRKNETETGAAVHGTLSFEAMPQVNAEHD